MQLLTFAHRPEARAFLEEFKTTMLENNSLYRFDAGYILITGEGIFDSLSRISAVLSRHPEIKEVINLGVAGALDSSLQIEEIFQIRTAYLEFNEKPEFHSFSLADTDLPFKKVDCLTSSRRVLSQSTAQALLPFASLVDRELWSQAKACHDSKRPLTSLKLISDIPSQEEEHVCQLVSEKAPFYSAKLFSAYQLLNKIQPNKKEFSNSVFLHEEKFHFTSSMRQALNSKARQINLKFQGKSFEELIDLNSILEKEIRPKEKALLLLDEMNYILNPYKVALERRLHQLSLGVVSAGFKAKFDPHLEKPLLHLNACFQSEAELKKAGVELSKFDFKKLKELLDGDFNV